MNDVELIKLANLAIVSAVVAYEDKELKVLFDIATQEAGLKRGVIASEDSLNSYENLKKMILIHFPEGHKMYDDKVIDNYIMINLYCFLGGENSDKLQEIFLQNTFK